MMKSDPVQCRIPCRVQPRASRNGIAGKLGEAWKVALTAPPVEGKANAALIEFFAKLFAVPKRQISISAGEHSRNKTVIIENISDTYAQEILTRNNGGK